MSKTPASNNAPETLLRNALNTGFKGAEQEDRARGDTAYAVTLVIGEWAKMEPAKCAPLAELAQKIDKSDASRKTHGQVMDMLRDMMDLNLSSDKRKALGETQRHAHDRKRAALQVGYDLARAFARLNAKPQAKTVGLCKFDDKLGWQVPLALVMDKALPKKDGMLPSVPTSMHKDTYTVRRASYWLELAGRGEERTQCKITYDVVLTASGMRGTTTPRTNGNEAAIAAQLSAIGKLTEADKLPDALGKMDDEASALFKLTEWLVNHNRAGVEAALRRRARPNPDAVKVAKGGKAANAGTTAPAEAGDNTAATTSTSTDTTATSDNAKAQAAQMTPPPARTSRNDGTGKSKSA